MSDDPEPHLNLFTPARHTMFCMKVTFLGTNGWYDTVTGNTCSVLVQSEKFDIIFDAGNGIAKADRYITQEKPVYLFLSHFHLDHIAGLHTLVKFKFRKGLTICGQPGTKEVLDSFVREPFTVPFAKLPYQVNFLELSEGEHPVPFQTECRWLVHPVPCFARKDENFPHHVGTAEVDARIWFSISLILGPFHDLCERNRAIIVVEYEIKRARQHRFDPVHFIAAAHQVVQCTDDR